MEAESRKAAAGAKQLVATICKGEQTPARLAITQRLGRYDISIGLPQKKRRFEALKAKHGAQQRAAKAQRSKLAKKPATIKRWKQLCVEAAKRL